MIAVWESDISATFIAILFNFERLEHQHYQQKIATGVLEKEES